MGTRCADHVTTLYPQKLALISPTGGGRSVGIVRSRTKATEFSLVLVIPLSVIPLSVISLSVISLSVISLSVIPLSVISLSVISLSVIYLSVISLSVIP